MSEFLFSNYVGKLALVDFLIVVAYLTLTLAIGLLFAKKATNFRNYAIGAKDFTTPALTATVVATFISSTDIIGLTEAVHSTGFLWVWLFMGVCFGNLITLKFIVPNINYSKTYISVGELMGEIYGKKARIITGIAGLLDSLGSITAQVIAIGIICESFFGLNALYGVVIGAGIVIIYASFGGIHAVTITDIFQILFIAVAVPLIFNICIVDVGGYANLINMVPAETFSLTPDGYSAKKSLMLFLAFYSLPFLRPATMQRILMANNKNQAKKSLAISSFIYVLFYLIVGGIGLLTVIYYPNMESKQVFMHLFDDKLLPIYKGFIISGIIAASMSTSDSILNVASVMLTNDILKPLKEGKLDDKTMLKIAKIGSLLIGIVAIITSLFFKSIVELVVTFFSFWASIITVPLFFGIIGFRASERTYLSSAAAGFSTFLIWKIFNLEEVLGIDNLFVCLAVNLLVFFTLRHLEKDKLPEAFVHIKPYGDMDRI